MIEQTAPWLYYARLAVMSLGAFTIGFALYVATLYLRGQLATRSYRHAAHVVGICASYCLLAGTMVITLGERLVHDKPLDWRSPVALVAFALGGWALSKLIKERARDPLREERRKGERHG